MTVSESIITWLREFKLKKIDTDIQRAGTGRYSLAKEPVQNVKSYLSGKKEYTDHYTFRACMPNAECIDNNVFGEELTEWVNEQNRLGNYPVLQDATVKEIRITTPFFMGATSENDSVYQMTIAIKYVKER